MNRSRARIALLLGAALLAAVAPARAQSSSIVKASPTVFFRDPGGGLLAQQADLTLAAPLGSPAGLTVELNGRSLASTIPAGVTVARVDVPDAGAGVATFTVDGEGPFSTAWAAQRKWTVWVMPTSHVDLYSTANAAYTPRQHVVALNTALDLIDAHPDFQFQIENALPLEQLLELEPSGAGRLRAAFATGRLAVGGQYTGVHQAETSDESLVQGQYAFSGALDAMKTLGTKPESAAVYDVPGVTPQAPQVLARSGIKYLLFSPNHSYRLYERMQLPYLFRWKAPDGSSVLAWRSSWNYTYEKNQYYNLQGTQEDAEATLAQMLSDRERGVYRNPYGEVTDLDLPFPYRDLLVIWDYGDNTPATREPIDVVHRWNERWAFPKFQMTTFPKFMDHMSDSYDASSIPERSGEVLDAWTYIVANQGLINQFTRRAERDLPAAATWDALASRLSGADSQESEETEQIWRDIAWTEAHDWFYGAFPLADMTGLPIPNPGLPLPFGAGEGKVPAFMVPDLDKAGWAREAESLARAMLDRSLRRIAAQIAADNDEVLVLNNATQTRSDLVAIPATSKHVVDVQTGREVPVQRIAGALWATGLGARPAMAIDPVADAAAQQTGDVTVFVADDVPGIGYRRFALRALPGLPSPSASGSGYSVGFDAVTGAISSLKAPDGRELVDSSAPWKLGELLLGLPATDFGDIFDEPQPVKSVLQEISAQSMQTVVGGFPGAAGLPACGPVLCEWRVAGTVADEHRTMSVITYRALDRVDLVISTAFTKVKQERFVASFPLAGSADEITYSEPFAVHRVGTDELPTEPSVHRQLTDWIEVGDGAGHATAVTSADAGVFTLGRADVNLMNDQYTVPENPWYYPIVLDTTAGGPVSAGTYVNRFSIASGAPGVGASLAASEREPLRALVVGRHAGRLSEPSASLIEVQGGRVTAVKPWISGSGLVLRVVADGEHLRIHIDPLLDLGAPRAATLQEEATRPVFGNPSRWEIVTLVYGPKGSE